MSVFSLGMTLGQSSTKPTVNVFGTHLFNGTRWIVDQESSVEGDGVDLKRANAGLLEVVIHSTKSLEAKCSDLVRKLNLLQK